MAESSFKDIDELPLGKLVQIKYPKSLDRKKKQSLTGKLKVKGYPKKKK